MSKVKRLFGEINMTWAKVIILAVVTAVYTALINQVHALKNTSFQDIAVCYECWFVFAIFIIVNCKKWWEASLKCFVFFLISQPLIFLIEVPFYRYGWEIFMYYPRWFFITLLTLPGAAIAFLLKKKNIISVLVLSVATAFFAYSSVMYFGMAMSNFPRHLLSSIFCFAAAIFFIFVLLDKKSLRGLAIGIFAAVLAVSIYFAVVGTSGSITTMQLDEGNWSYTIAGDDIVDVEITDGNHVTLTSKKNGRTAINFVSDDGTEQVYDIISDRTGMRVELCE